MTEPTILQTSATNAPMNLSEVKVQQPQSNIIVVPAENLPSQAFSVSLEEPKYEDRREASRRHPGTNAKAGFSVEELLLSNCMVAINGNDYGPYPRDPISKYRELPGADAYALLSIFIGLCTLDDELADDAQKLADELSKTKANYFTIPATRMPSHTLSVTFRTASSGDRIDADKRYPGADSGCGYSLEELFFVSCLEHINGAPFQKNLKDLPSVMDKWLLLDVQYAVAVFINMFTIDRQQASDLRDLGKSLRTGATKKNTDLATPTTAITTAI